MDNTNELQERKKRIAASLRQWTPEELKKLDEELAEAVKAANEYTKAQGWQDDSVKNQ